MLNQYKYAIIAYLKNAICNYCVSHWSALCEHCI